MAPTVTITLDSLHRESPLTTEDVAPYLWVTYLFTQQGGAHRADPLHSLTPVTDAFRAQVALLPPGDVPDGDLPDAAAGSTSVAADRTPMAIPPHLGRCTMEVDDTTLGFPLVGVLVVLWDDHHTALHSARSARTAFLASLHEGLNEMVRARVGMGAGEASQEVEAVRESLEPIVSSAIRSTLSLWDQLRERRLPMVGFCIVGGAEIHDQEFSTASFTDTAGTGDYRVTGHLRVHPAS